MADYRVYWRDVCLPFDRPAAVVRDANTVDLNRQAAGRHRGFGHYRREPVMHEASEHADWEAMRNNQHLLSDPVRGTGELIECPELFTIETTPRAS